MIAMKKGINKNKEGMWESSIEDLPLNETRD